MIAALSLKPLDRFVHFHPTAACPPDKSSRSLTLKGSIIPCDTIFDVFTRDGADANFVEAAGALVGIKGDGTDRARGERSGIGDGIPVPEVVRFPML